MMIFTVGYHAGWSPVALAHWVTYANTVVVDIRDTPALRCLAWCPSTLQQLLGLRYVHLPFVGYRTFSLQHRPQSRVRLDIGFATLRVLLQQYRSLVILCGCSNVTTCHRAVVATELWRRSGCLVITGVTHLHPTDIAVLPTTLPVAACGQRLEHRLIARTHRTLRGIGGNTIATDTNRVAR